MGALCHVFPEEGVKLGSISLEFPTLDQVLGEDEDEVITEESPISPELLLEEWTFAAPTHFHFPGNDLTFFDSLFVALEQADSIPVRILHYGDSQIEEDRISNVIRDTLQKMFGGNGQGMMPARKHYTASTGSNGTSGERYMVFANRCEGNKYGPYGDFVRIEGQTRLSYYPSGIKGAGVRHFNKVTLVAGNTRGEGLKVSCGGKTVTIPADRDLSKAVFHVPDSSVRVTLDVSGSGDLYGVLLDERHGVALDNVPMRGCSGTIFTSMNSGQIEKFCRSENVGLILMQFGGNRVPSISNRKQISNYCTNVRRQIDFMKRQAPDAAIVFVGPSDMATSIKGKFQTYPMLPELVDSLRHTANSAGAAYWDIYGAMGGRNSMAAWVKASPALAGADHVHFTKKGAAHMGEMMAGAFRMHYDYYVWRKENDN